MVLDEVKRLQVVSYCATQLERFPDDEIDEQVLIMMLEVFALASAGSKTVTKFISDGGALNKIVLQLSIVLEELNQGVQKLQPNELQL